MQWLIDNPWAFVLLLWLVLSAIFLVLAVRHGRRRLAAEPSLAERMRQANPLCPKCGTFHPANTEHAR